MADTPEVVVLSEPARPEPTAPTPHAEDRALLREGDSVLFIDRKKRQYLRTLKAERRVNVRDGMIVPDALIGQPEGIVVRSSMGEYLQVFRPTYAQIAPNLPRQAQLIYAKDIGTILLYGDIHPGARVIEVGVGPGATSLALIRAVGPTGRVVSYEIRDDFADMARGNVKRFHGEAPQWTVRAGDAYEGLDERDFDRIVIDVPEPWRVIPHAAKSLRPGGVFVGFIPTVLQMKQLVDELRDGGFAAVDVIESLQRFWHVKERSVRPEHRMVAHSGFLVIGRRLAATPGTP